jgi:hypothetical protein
MQKGLVFSVRVCYRIHTNSLEDNRMKKEDTSLRIARRNYEERNKEQRKAQNKTWGTSISRQTADEIDAFLKLHNLTKVDLIFAGFIALQEKYKNN